jgi:hypothetical protein
MVCVCERAGLRRRDRRVERTSCKLATGRLPAQVEVRVRGEGEEQRLVGRIFSIEPTSFVFVNRPRRIALVMNDPQANRKRRREVIGIAHGSFEARQRLLSLAANETGVSEEPLDREVAARGSRDEPAGSDDCRGGRRQQLGCVTPQKVLDAISGTVGEKGLERV